jgi:hypothetical protein
MPATAALITTEFSELVDNKGTVDIKLALAPGENPAGFSLFFSADLFADLTIITSPAQWDSLVFQPDSLLGAGMFDSYHPAGLNNGFARVSFTYLATIPFAPLAYDFYDADYQIIASGETSLVAASVPESSPVVLLLMGLLGIYWRSRSHAATRTRSGKLQQVAL